MNLIFGLKCEKVERWVLESFDKNLLWHQQMMLRVHCFTCVMCRKSAKQIQILHQIYQKLTHPAQEDPAIGLPPSAKQRIRDALL